MSAFRAAIRPTVRDVRRHPWRTLAAIVLIALPVAFLTFQSIRDASYLRYYDTITTPNSARFYGGQCEQTPTSSSFDCANRDETSTEPITIGVPEVEQALGGRFTVNVWASSTTVVRHGEHSANVSLEQLPDAVPLPGGQAVNPGEIVLSDTDAKMLKASVGDTVEFTDAGKTRTLTVVSIMPAFISYVANGTLTTLDTITTSDSITTVSFVGDTTMTWEDVKALNALGFVVDSEDVLQHPPALEEQYPAFQEITDAYPSANGFWAGFGLVVLSLIVYGLVVGVGLQIIAPIFALSASRQSANYSLMRSQGASKAHIRLAVLTYGALAGLVGATLGLAIGVGACVAWWNTTYPGWPLDADPPTLAGYWLIAVLGATAAAFIPAVIAANAPIMAGVEGAQPDRLRRWKRWMAVGPVATVALYLLALLLRWAGSLEAFNYPIDEEHTRQQQLWSTILDIVVPLLWLVVTVGGLIAATASIPALMYAIGTIRRPLAARLAGRMARRQALRSSAIVAALIGIVGIGTAINVNFTAEAARTHDLESQYYRNGHAFLGSWTAGANPTPLSPAAAVAAMADPSTVPDSVRSLAEGARQEIQAAFVTVTPVYGVHDYGDYGESSILTFEGNCDDYDTDTRKSYPYCIAAEEAWLASIYSPLMDRTLLASDALLSAYNLDDVAKANASTQLAAGGALVPSNYQQMPGFDGSLRFALEDWPLAEDTEPVRTLAPQDSPVAAVMAPNVRTRILSEQVFADLGLELYHQGYLLTFTDEAHELVPITSSDDRKIGAMLDEQAPSMSFTPLVTHRPWLTVSAVAVGAVLLVILGLILVLSAPSVRANNEQLYALGAPDKLLRAVGAWYSGLLAALGTIIPLIIGHLIGLLTLRGNSRLSDGTLASNGMLSYFTIDWSWVLILGVAVPVIAALMGYLATRPLGQMGAYRQD